MFGKILSSIGNKNDSDPTNEEEMSNSGNSLNSFDAYQCQDGDPEISFTTNFGINHDADFLCVNVQDENSFDLNPTHDVDRDHRRKDTEARNFLKNKRQEGNSSLFISLFMDSWIFRRFALRIFLFKEQFLISTKFVRKMKK